MTDNHLRPHGLTSDMVTWSVKSIPGKPEAVGVLFGAYGFAEVVTLATVQQPFGGLANFFRCPSCNRRCRKLYGEPYLAATGWKCRKCWGLVYPSQRQRRSTRQWVRAQRLSDELADRSTPHALVRPKGMHFATFRKRVRRIRELESQAVLPVLRLLMETQLDKSST